MEALKNSDKLSLSVEIQPSVRNIIFSFYFNLRGQHYEVNFMKTTPANSF